MNLQLRQRLLDMAHEDQCVRAELAATGELFQGYSARMAEVHRQNAEELRRIIAKLGWPGNSLVGVDGAHAAWLILQHAIAHPQLQKECLPLLRKAAERAEAEPQ